MKKATKLFGIIAIVAVIGLTMAGCSSFSVSTTQREIPQAASNPFPGTWSGTDMDGDSIRFVFDATRVTISYPDTGASNSTTYTYSDNVATFSTPGFTAKAAISEDAMTVLAGEEHFASLTKQ